MKLKHLLNQYSNDEIFNELSKSHNDLDKKYYLKALDEMVDTIPANIDNMIITISLEKNIKGIDYLDCYGLESGDDSIARWGLSYTSWSKMLGMNVSAKSIEEYGELKSLAAIIHTMTFYGCSYAEIEENFDTMLD